MPERNLKTMLLGVIPEDLENEIINKPELQSTHDIINYALMKANRRCVKTLMNRLDEDDKKERAKTHAMPRSSQETAPPGFDLDEIVKRLHALSNSTGRKKNEAKPQLEGKRL